MQKVTANYISLSLTLRRATYSLSFRENLFKLGSDFRGISNGSSGNMGEYGWVSHRKFALRLQLRGVQC